jgi:hypothetical protein
VYKGNEKGMFRFYSTHPEIPRPMREIDVDDLVVEKVNIEFLEVNGEEETFLRVIVREETPSEKVKRLIPWERMDEIANKCLDGMYEAEPVEADEFCKGELDFTPYENEYFNVPRANSMFDSLFDESEEF